MSSKSEDCNQQNDGLGTISILSKEKTVHNPSLVLDIWEFEHDPEDEAIKNIIGDKQKHLKQRHSLQRVEEMKKNQLFDRFNPQKGTHHSQLTLLQEKRTIYGFSKMFRSNEKKIISKSPRCKKSRKKKEGSEMIEKVSMGSLSEEDKGKQQELYRNIDILQHRNLSNINYLMRQTKEQLLLNKMNILQLEREATKKQLMKMEIQCRKLRIGLRSSNSFQYLQQLRNKRVTFSFKASFMKSPKNQLPQQKMLLQRIGEEKKKINELGTRESLLSNYYNVMKERKNGRSSHHLQIEKSRSVGRKKEKSRGSVLGGMEYYEILESKRRIVKQSLEESRNHTGRKCEQIVLENKLLKEELAIIQLKNEKILQMQKNLETQRGWKSKKYRMANEQLSINLSRTKRKLQIRKGFGNKDYKSYYYRSPQMRVKSQKYLKAKYEEENNRSQYFSHFPIPIQ